eukprot:CCRYP_011275-RA/>CCRYP_011275-RA protein AED:0.44 eAED:0.44 QI:0/0/0.33/1/0/0/3/769/105
MYFHLFQWIALTIRVSANPFDLRLRLHPPFFTLQNEPPEQSLLPLHVWLRREVAVSCVDPGNAPSAENWDNARINAKNRVVTCMNEQTSRRQFSSALSKLSKETT